MSITRVNPIGFALGDTFTAAQANGIDQNTTFGLDKRSGQTDTLASIVAVTGRLDVSGELHVTGTSFAAEDLAVDALHAHTSDIDEGTVATRLTVGAGAALEYTNNYPKLGATHPDRNIVRRAIGSATMGISATALAAPSISAVLSNAGSDLYLSTVYASFTAVSASDVGKQLAFDITPYMLHGAKVTNVAVGLIPIPGHVALPTFMPRAAVFKVDSTTVTNISGTIIDPSATFSAYDAPHEISIPCAPTVIDKSTTNFYVLLLNEGGTNSTPGLVIPYLNIFQSVTEVSQG